MPPANNTVGTVDPHCTHNPVYEEGYRDSWHWNYRRWGARIREWWKLKHHIVDRIGLKKGSRVLEVACGQGYHVQRLRQMGFVTTGVDISPAGIDFALRSSPRDDYRCLDAAAPMPFTAEEFDLIWSYGAGFFHYCITDDATAAIVREHLKYLKPGGHYLVMVATNLTGDRPKRPLKPWAFTWQHTEQDVRAMLLRHGPEVAVDWFPIRRFLIGPRVQGGHGYVVGTLRKPYLPTLP